MNEDELKIVDHEEEDAAFLPDGWQEGDDFFADPSTWSGASHESGQTDETHEEEESTEADMETEEVPTTDETEETADQSAEQDAVEESGQTTTSEKRSRILKLKVNHKDQEVDIESMTDDELIEALQKSRAFDAMKDEQAKARYREVYHEQVSEGMTPAAARLVAANEVGGKNYPLEDTVEPEKPSTPVTTPVTEDPVAKTNREIGQLKKLFKDFKEMPEEVALAHAEGVDLVTAYVAYRSQQSEKAAATLKKENEVLKQNAASAAKAPVKGITGGGATNTKPTPGILKGFDDDAW